MQAYQQKNIVKVHLSGLIKYFYRILMRIKALIILLKIEMTKTKKRIFSPLIIHTNSKENRINKNHYINLRIIYSIK
jgi:hypothetical protein